MLKSWTIQNNFFRQYFLLKFQNKAWVIQIKIFCMEKFSAGLSSQSKAINIIWNLKVVYFYIHIWKKKPIYAIFPPSIGNLKLAKHFFHSVIKANAVENMLCKTTGEISYEMKNVTYLFFKEYMQYLIENV